MTETPDPYAPPPQQPPGPPQPPSPPPYPPATPPVQPQAPAYPPQQGYPPPGYAQQPAYPQQPPQPYPPAAYGAPPGGYPGQPTGTLPTGLAIAALVVGIVGCLGFWVPFGGVLLGVVALVLGIVAWRRASSGRAGGMAMAVIGTVLGGLAILGGILATVFLVWIIRTTADCYDPSWTDEQVQACIEDSVNNRLGVE